MHACLHTLVLLLAVIALGASGAQACEQLEPDGGFVANILTGPDGKPIERRVALVVGNGAYHASIGVLKNPANDAAAVAQAFQGLGFKVFKSVDASASEINSCRARMQAAAEKTDIAVLYYSGHGIQIDDANYLVAVDARLAGEDKAGLVPVAPIVNASRKMSGLCEIERICRSAPVHSAG